MAFLNKLNLVAKSAAKSAAELANDAIGSGKLAMKIKREELLIEEQYEKIGEYFYQKRNEGQIMPPELEECCVAIDISLASIKELEEARSELRENPEVSFEEDIPYEQEACQRVICTNCGKEAKPGALFCSNCGNKLPSV